MHSKVLALALLIAGAHAAELPQAPYPKDKWVCTGENDGTRKCEYHYQNGASISCRGTSPVACNGMAIPVPDSCRPKPGETMICSG
jgi:hypothetical protein